MFSTIVVYCYLYVYLWYRDVTCVLMLCHCVLHYHGMLSVQSWPLRDRLCNPAWIASQDVGKVERHKTVTRLDLGIMVKGRHYLLNLIWVICLRYINGRLYLLMVMDLLYAMIVRFVWLNLYIICRQTNRLWRLLPFWSIIEYSG